MTNDGLVEANRPSFLSNFDPTFDPAVDERRKSLPAMESETNKTETYFKTFEDEDSESESDEVKPYYGHGFRVYFDSLKDRRHFMRAFGFN